MPLTADELIYLLTHPHVRCAWCAPASDTTSYALVSGGICPACLAKLTRPVPKAQPIYDKAA